MAISESPVLPSRRIETEPQTGSSRRTVAVFDPVGAPSYISGSFLHRSGELRAYHPALLAVSRAMAELRESMITQWANWLGDRLGTAPTFPRSLTERELRLLIDALTEMVGPMRREVKPVWYSACEQYGRMAAARGLAAGEVVEEIQYLREVLIRHLSPVLAAMRARQGMATMLRLNRVVDKGVATAVVGYTDALIATLFVQNGVPKPDTELDAAEISRQLDTLEEELAAATRPNGKSPAA